MLQTVLSQSDVERGEDLKDSYIGVRCQCLPSRGMSPCGGRGREGGVMGVSVVVVVVVVVIVCVQLTWFVCVCQISNPFLKAIKT